MIISRQILIYVCCLFFFFKQKTAYEMRISDWSSDVCSSDLSTTCAKRSAKSPSMSCVPRTACGVGILADLSLLMAAASNGFSSKGKARLQSGRWTFATFGGRGAPHEKSTVRRSGRHRRPRRLFPRHRPGRQQPPPAGRAAADHPAARRQALSRHDPAASRCDRRRARHRSEEHTSELQSLMRISYAVFCLKKTTKTYNKPTNTTKKKH